MIRQVFADGMVSASIYLLVALGFALVYSTGRFLHFAHGAIFALAPYAMLAALRVPGMPLPAAALVGVAAAMAAGCLIDLGIYRPLRKRRAPPLVLLLASLGIYVVVQNAISMVWGDGTEVIRSGGAGLGRPIVGVYLAPIRLATLVTSAVLAAVLWGVLKWTKWGRAYRAVASDSELAVVSGIDSDTTIIWSLAIGSALAGVAGVLVALDTGMTPDMGMLPLMMAIVVMIVGGSRSVPGVALAAVFVGVTQHLAVLYMPAQWKDCVAFILLLFFLLVRPQGILGKRAKTATV